MKNTRLKISLILALLFLLPYIVSGAAASFPYENRITIENGIKHFDRGEIRYFDGVPVLKLEGSHLDMGLQYGVLMKTELNQVAGEIETFKDDIAASYPFFVRPIVPLLINFLLNDMKKRFPQYYIDEIKGMSEGSGVDFSTLLFMAAGGGLINNSSCTSILVKLDDRIIHGRNFDWEPPLLGKFPIIVNYNPTGKKSFTSFSFVGFPGAIQAVNENKLSLSVNIAFGMYKEGNDGLPIIYKTREIMENASDLKAAGDIIRKFRTDESGWMVTIGSANETSGAIFEMYDNHITETPMKGKYEYVHNILFQPEFVGNIELSKKYNEVFLGQAQWNLARHYATEHFILEKGINSIDDMADYLKNADLYEYKNVYLTDCSTINNEFTVNTLIFDLKNDAFYCAFAPGYSAFARMYKYNLKDRTLTFFREADPRMESPELKEKMNWYYDYKKYQYRGEFKKMLEKTDFTRDMGPGQLTYIVNAWKDDKVIKPEILIAGIDRQIAKYPHYGLLYLLKADVLRESGKIEDAAEIYERALATPHLSSQYRLEILSQMAKINIKENPAAAIEPMLLYCSLIDELRKTHHIDEKLEKDYKKFRKIILH